MRAKKRHKRHDKRQAVYATVVYTQTPVDELVDAEDDTARSLAERGDYLTGRPRAGGVDGVLR